MQITYAGSSLFQLIDHALTWTSIDHGSQGNRIAVLFTVPFSNLYVLMIYIIHNTQYNETVALAWNVQAECTQAIKVNDMVAHECISSSAPESVFY